MREESLSVPLPVLGSPPCPSCVLLGRSPRIKLRRSPACLIRWVIIESLEWVDAWAGAWAGAWVGGWVGGWQSLPCGD